MKKNSTIRLLACLHLALVFSGCTNEVLNPPLKNSLVVLNNDEDFYYAEYNAGELMLSFKSSKIGGIIQSELELHSKGVEKLSISNQTNLKLEAYKLNAHNNVLSGANKLLSEIEISFDGFIKVFESFSKSILHEENTNSYSPLIQELFIYNAIINTAKRSVDQKSSCLCTPHPGYYVDRTPFWCQEDFIIDTKVFLNIFQKVDFELNNSELRILNFLKNANLNNQIVTIDKVLEIAEEKDHFINRVNYRFQKINNFNITAREDDCFLGSDIGCCGNYGGCCWYSSLFCLYHDAACVKCSKWHCGPACQVE